MKVNLKTLVTATLVLLIMLFASSCKKNEVKKVAIDTQFAVAMFSDTVALRQIINDMDSTTQNWLRVRNDSIFVYYVDTIKSVLKASDLLSNISDVSFETTTEFTMPMYDPTNTHDTVIDVDRFMTVPFHYEGFNIEEVLLRDGMLSFDFDVVPIIEHLKRLEIYSNQLLTPEGEPLSIVIDYYNKGRQYVDLSQYSVVPENDTVAFGARMAIHIDSGIYEGGEYLCYLAGGLTGVRFNTVYGTIDIPLDSVFYDMVPIDFGVSGLTGSAVLPIPTINIAYNNTFGFGAICDVSTLGFINTTTGQVTDLLESDVVEVQIDPTEGEWNKMRITGLTENIDALAGYTLLNFGGEAMMLLNDHQFSISDTSTVDIAADIEMPMSFKLTDLCYTDTIPFNIVNNDSDNDIDDYFDEIEFYIDYNSKIKIDVDMQALFMRNGFVIDSLFNSVESLDYSTNNEIKTIMMTVNGRKLNNVLRADNLLLRLGASTDAISADPIMMMDTDEIFLRLRVLTKTSEINFDNF